MTQVQLELPDLKQAGDIFRRSHLAVPLAASPTDNDLHYSRLWSAALYVRHQSSRNLDCNPQVSWLRSKPTNHQKLPVVFISWLRVQLCDSFLHQQNKNGSRSYRDSQRETRKPLGAFENSSDYKVLCSLSCPNKRVWFIAQSHTFSCFTHKKHSLCSCKLSPITSIRYLALQYI